MAFHKVIGIDLGTTYSAVSILDCDKGEVIVIPSAIGNNTIPSVVGLDLECNVVVGEPAQNNLITDPDNTIIEVKREMGVYEREPNPRIGDPGDPRRIRFRGRSYLPQEISAFILIELKRQAENYIGEPIHDTVVTVPVYFKELQKRAIIDAAAMARLNVKYLLDGPVAAAVCFGVDKARDKKRHLYAVYDLGGGTCDISIIEVTTDGSRVVGTGGDPWLGGSDFDDYITGYVLQQIQAKHGVDLSHDPAIWARIKGEAEIRKRELSALNSTTIHLPFLTPQLNVQVSVTRATFEFLIDDLLKDSLTCLNQAIKSADKSNGIGREEIRQVLLVGGSTWIPCIRFLLAKHLGMGEKDVRIDTNPVEAVSRGAALIARNYNPSKWYEGKETLIDRSQSYYSLLDVPPKAIPKKIREACDRKTKELRERQRSTKDIDERQNLYDRLKEVNIAYETLLRSTSRKEYDRVNARLIALEADANISKQLESTVPLVFISVKSNDYSYAQQIYEFLMSHDVPTFFSQESLLELGDTDFRKAVYRALDQVKHMIIVTSCIEHVCSHWVEAEWGFFINEKHSGRKSGNLIIVTVGSLQRANLPPALRYCEIISFNQQALKRILGYVGN